MNEAQEAIFQDMQAAWVAKKWNESFRKDCERLIKAGAIVVDIGEAVAALESSPELCETMGRLLNIESVLSTQNIGKDVSENGQLVSKIPEQNGKELQWCSAGSEAEIARVHDIIARAISSDGLTHSGLRRAARDVYEHMNDDAQGAAVSEARERVLAAIADLQGEHEVMAGPFDPTKWKIDISVSDLQALASQPSPAATVETPPDWKQDQAETSRLPRQHLDASKWPSKAAMEASHARSSAGTDVVKFPRWWVQKARDQLFAMDKLPSGPLGDWAFLFREMLNDALTKAVPQAVREPGRGAVAAIVLKAMQAKVDPDTYGDSYAIKINADRAVIAADAILSMPRPQ